MKTFCLNTDLLKSCSFAMSKEEARYYLMGVHVYEKEGKIVYEATNGHFLVRGVDSFEQIEREPEGLNIIIPANLVKHIIKAGFRSDFGAGALPIECSVDGTRITLEMFDSTISFKLIDGAFPDTDRVIPKKQSCKELSFDQIGLNTKYLSDIAKSFAAINKNGVAGFAFSGEGADSPVVVSSTLEEIDWMAVLMPARI